MTNDRAPFDFDVQSPWGTWSPKGFPRLALNFARWIPPAPPGRRLALLLRRIVKYGNQPLYDVEIWGARLRLMARGNLSEQRWLTMEKFHDVMERNEIANCLGPDSVFLDVGANAGFYSFWVLTRNFPGVRIVAVEPNPRMNERIRFNLRLNGLEDRISLVEGAVAKSSGEVTLHENPEALGESSISMTQTGTKVQAYSLEHLLADQKCSKMDVLKIDIEGGESDVLDSYFRSVDSSRWPHTIVGEIMGENGKTFASLLNKQGYTLKNRSKLNGVFKFRS